MKKLIFTILLLSVSCQAFSMSQMPASKSELKDDRNLVVGYAGHGVQNSNSIKDAVMGAVENFANQCSEAQEISCLANPSDPVCAAYDTDDINNISIVEAREAAKCIATIWSGFSDSLAATIYSIASNAYAVSGFLDSPAKQYDIYQESLLTNQDDKPEFFYNTQSGQSVSETSNRAPAYADFKGKQYMAFIDAKKRLKITSRDAGEGEQFGWAIPKQINSHKSSDKPSLMSFNGYLYVAFKGSGSKKIYISRTSNGVHWSQARQVNNHQSSYSPTLAVVTYSGSQYLVAGFRGAGSKKLYFTQTLDGVNWSSARRVSHQSSNAPYLTAHNGKVFAAFKGASTRNLYIMHSSDAGLNWSSPIKLNSSYRSNRAPAIASHNERLYLTFKGIGTNNIYWTYSVNNGSSWAAAKVYTKSDNTSSANKTSGSLTLYSSDLMY